MNPNKGQKILLLTLVHPDFLPPVYAIAQTLRDLGYQIHILTFESMVRSEAEIGKNIVVESLGKHHNASFTARIKLRRNFSSRAAKLVSEHPTAVIAFCPFSYLTALRHKGTAPVVYFALEIADATPAHLLRSPLTGANNYLTLQRVHKADLVATPSVQRSAWLAGRCHLSRMPHTILNSGYHQPSTNNEYLRSLYKKVVPEHFVGKKTVLYTGGVNDYLCVFDLVKAFDLANGSNSALIVTGMKDNSYCNEIRAFAAASKLSSNMLLLPYVTRDEMLALQASADIGACLVRESDDNIRSKMIAPNKVGEYLEKELYILGTNNEYLRPLEAKGIATLAATPTPADISIAIQEALAKTQHGEHKATIAQYVAQYFCMQYQAKPIIELLNELSK
jgi:hypothetical protein